MRMKKIFTGILLIIFAISTLTGCNKLPVESLLKKDTPTGLLAKMKVREDILSAMETAKKLSGGDFVMASDGGYYYQESCKNYAYAYFDEPVVGVYADASSDPFILAVFEDGRVYNATTPIAEEISIRDVCWKTHDTNIDAYLLGEDGQLYYYNPYNEKSENEFILEEGYENITAICRAGSYALFFCADGHVAVPNIFMSGGSAEWKDIEVKNWKEIVVAACAYEEREEVYTIAGISADGAVHATGTYAEDILAMGDLAYITMFDDASLIAGLTPDGTVKFAGSDADDYAGIVLRDIAGVKAFDDRVWAMGNDGSIYVIEHDGDMVTLSEEGSTGSYPCFYMATNGDVLINTDNRWTKSNELNAGVADHTNLLYYLEMSKQKINHGRGFQSSYSDLDDCKFIAYDVNGDGQREIITAPGVSIYISCIYNGTLSTSLYTGDVVGYYPEAQVIVTVRYGAQVEDYDYGHFIHGAYTLFATRCDYHLEGKEPYETYEYFIKKDELPSTDEEGDELRRENKQAMSKGEFHALLENMVGKEPMQEGEIGLQTAYPCTKESYAEVFLDGADLPDDVELTEKETLPLDAAESKPTVQESLNPQETGEGNAENREYILPNSSTVYLTQDDLQGLSAKELQIARNEIYARHGRKFQSQELQDHFNSKTWYRGTIEPENFSESLLSAMEKKNIELIKHAEETAGITGTTETAKTAGTTSALLNLPVAPSKKIIDRYGYEKGYSVLSFHTIEGTLKDCGEYYQIDAVYRQGIEAPRNLRDGEQVTLVFNELTGETKTLTYHNDRFFPEGVTDYYQAYYYYPTSDGKSAILYQDSEDRVDKPVYEGKLYIRKDATQEVAIVHRVQAVTRENLDREDWYNGVYFDEKGYVTRLVFYGD